MKALMKGNEAIAASAIAAGCRAFFGYPITPQSEILEYMSANMGLAGGVFIQAESELAAINMVYGAAATGVRAMTSSASPGIALKQEGISYMAGARLPCLIVSMARSGPGLGGILPAQGDYFQATRGGGNGDYYIPVYAPGSVQEAADLVQRAFNVAEAYRTPVMLLGDGMLGQMMEPAQIGSAKRIQADMSWAANAGPGRPRNIINSLNLSPQGLEQMNLERFAIYDEISTKETMAELNVQEGDEIVLVAYGTPARIVKSAVVQLAEKGISAGMIRPITLWPFPDSAFQNLPNSVETILVAELSMGQMVQDVRLAVNGRLPVEFYGRAGGMVFEPEEIASRVFDILRK